MWLLKVIPFIPGCQEKNEMEIILDIILDVSYVPTMLHGSVVQIYT